MYVIWWLWWVDVDAIIDFFLFAYLETDLPSPISYKFKYNNVCVVLAYHKQYNVMGVLMLFSSWEYNILK